MIDNEANPPAFNHEFRVWCVRHRNVEIEILGWVDEFSRTLSEDKSSAILVQPASQKISDQAMAYREAGYTVACWSLGFRSKRATTRDIGRRTETK